MRLPKACACTNQPVRLKLQSSAKTGLYCKGTCKQAQGLRLLNSSYALADLEDATLYPFKEAS